MAISFVRNHGTATNAASANLTINLAAAVTSGSTLFLRTVGNTGFISAVTGGGTWTADITQNRNSTQDYLSVWRLHSHDTIASGTAITATVVGTTNTAVLDEFSGLEIDLGPLTSNSTHGSGTGITISSVTITDDNVLGQTVLLLAAHGIGASAYTMTFDGSYTGLTESKFSSVSNSAAYRVVSTSGAYSGTDTSSVSTQWSSVHLAYKGARAHPFIDTRIGG